MNNDDEGILDKNTLKSCFRGFLHPSNVNRQNKMNTLFKPDLLTSPRRLSTFSFLVQDYRQDCETFCTVVKMLVAKEPGLDNLLHRALNENLSELKQHCLDSLRLYVAELDEVLESHGTNAESQK